MALFSGNNTVGARDAQEDAFDVIAQSDQDPSGDILILVADGMGGHVGGEIASNLVVRAFKQHFISGSDAPKPKDRLLQSTHAANDALATEIAAKPDLKGMGCTLAAALKLNDRLIWSSVGDSHIYRFRGGALVKLNKDHSVYGELLELVAAGKLSQQEADANPRRNALRSAIIGKPLSLVDINAAALEHGDVIVVATDGLDTLNAAEITAVLAREHRSAPEEITQQLLDAVAAKDRRNQDNTTIVTYRHSAEGRSTWGPDSKWRITSGTEDAPRGALATPFRKSVAIVGVTAVVVALILWAVFARGADPVEQADDAVPPVDRQVETEITTTAPVIQQEGGEAASEDGGEAAPQGDAIGQPPQNEGGGDGESEEAQVPSTGDDAPVGTTDADEPETGEAAPEDTAEPAPNDFQTGND